MASQCPNNAALYCDGVEPRDGTMPPDEWGGVYHQGTVGKVPLADILLDTGATRTLEQVDLIQPEQRVEGKVTIRCAHGDTVTY